MNPFRYKKDQGPGKEPARVPVTPAPAPVVVPSPHPSSIADEQLATQCDFTKDRGSGPGGQHRNKVESRVSIVHTPTGVEAMAGERRSAVENRRVAMFRLRLALAVAVRTPVPAGEIRSELWLTRCPEKGGGKISCNPEHHDYPTLLAEGLDVIWGCGLDVGKAALRLSCSASQLLKLVKDHPPALVRLNQAREAEGLHRLH